MSRKKSRVLQLRERLAENPEDTAARDLLEVEESVEADKVRVAARESRFIGGENVIRITAEKVPTTSAVQQIGKNTKFVDATRIAVAVPGWARPQVEAVRATDRDPDRVRLLDVILAAHTPDGCVVQIGAELPIEATYGEGRDDEAMA